MTDNRRRVYEEAKERGLSSDALVKVLREAGCEVKSHMSLLTDEMVVALNKRFEAEKELARADFERRKQVAEEAARAAAAGPTPIATPTMIAAALTEAGVLAAAKTRRKHKGPRALGSSEVELEELNPEVLAVVAKEATPRAAPTPGSSGKFQKFKGTGKAQDKKAIQENVKKTLAQLEAGRKVRRYGGRRDRDTGPVAEGEENVLHVAEYIAVSDLAMQMELKPSDVIGKCLSMGMMVTINQRLDFETIELLAHEFGYKAVRQEEFVVGTEEVEEADPHSLRPRPPVVTIMGHVDHGKTSLLDVIRNSNVVAGEAGGITQHIGAYEVDTPGGAITFLDTPGHEAFTAMRARGAQVTDIVVLVVAANDGVQPQTVEAVDHARAAGVPIIVAINKIDIPGSSPDQVKAQLAQHNVQVESWGGNVQCIEVSARQNLNVDKLLDAILLQAEVLDLKANPDTRARGTIVEARLDRGKGPTATVLVTTGTLRVGDPFVTGSYSGRIRAMYNERGKPIQDAPPSTPAQIVGLPGVPQAGDAFFVTESDAEAKDIASVREQLRREEQRRRPKRLALTDVYTAMKEGGLRELRLIIKADVDGSIEVLRDTVEKHSNEQIRVRVIHSGVGLVNESDVLLAAASDAVIFAFHVGVDSRARELANREKIDIHQYAIIYEVEEKIHAALEGMLEPEIKEDILGEAVVQQVFKIAKLGTISGSQVKSGLMRRNAKCRILRDHEIIYSGVITSLKRFKDDVREVQTGFECGIGVDNYSDFQADDVIQCYEVTSVKRKLETAPSTRPTTKQAGGLAYRRG